MAIDFTRLHARHLLSRTLLGFDRATLDEIHQAGLEKSIERLLRPEQKSTPPLNNYSAVGETDDLGIKYGETWINGTAQGNNDGGKRSSFKAWYMGQLIGQSTSLHQKMILFWHNHFATEMDSISDARFTYKHFDLLHTHALGSFKTLLRAICTDPGMLIYLNGSVNTKTAPDENFARELQELFTLGKEPGSKYTEEDVKAAARICTGFRHKRDTQTYTFNPANHDNTDKIFSAFYGKQIIKGRTGPDGEKELDELLEMILKQEEVAKHLVRRLYRFFFYYDISAQVEKEFIAPMAVVLRSNDYQIAPVLKAMFSSEHFFSEGIKAAVIKSPLELMVGFVQYFEIKIPTGDFAKQYGHWKWLRDKCRDMAQDPGDPPSVSGWPAYYQFPSYHEIWINADTLPKRNQVTNQLINSGYNFSGTRIQVDVLSWTKSLKQPEDPNVLIKEACEFLLALPLDIKTQQRIKKDILLDGQSTDGYWTELWTSYMKNPSDASIQKLVKTRLTNLYIFLTGQAEFHLS